MALLLISAGCLGLSNANADGFKMHGREARPERRKKQGPIIDAKKAQQLTNQQQMLDEPVRKVSLTNSSDEPRRPVSEMSRNARRQVYMDLARPTEAAGQEQYD